MGAFSINPPALPKDRIINQAEELARKYFSSVGPEWAKLGISFDSVYENVIYPEYEIVLVDDKDLGYDDRGKKILGEFDPVMNTAYIDVCLKPRNGDRRRAFTCWHEVGGHGILHGEWLRRNINRLHETRIVTNEDVIELKPESLFEWQANLFAAHAAAPVRIVDYAIEKTFGLEHRWRFCGPGRYSFCLKSGTQTHDVESFDRFCWWIANYIRRRFGGLSAQALSYQVALSKWVVDESKLISEPLKKNIRLRRVAVPA